MALDRPVFAIEAAHALKLAHVGGYQDQSASERLSGD